MIVPQEPFNQVRTPVLLIIFRRPELVATALSRLRIVRPPKLYVAADGPRAGCPDDIAGCAESRRLVETGIDWPCELKLRFRERNLGVQHGVVDAIDWIFEHEEQAIILEDDVAAEPDFFHFCDELLERYCDDQRIATISGTSYWQGVAQYSYHASNFIDMWGWATWRDRWKNYDAAMKAWPQFANKGRLGNMPGASPRFERYWRRIMDDTAAGKMYAWDYQWILSCWNLGQVSLFPSVPLVQNLGFDERATNTIARSMPRYCRLPGKLKFPLAHPPQLDLDPERERAMWAFRFHISTRDALVLFFKLPLARLMARIRKKLAR